MLGKGLPQWNVLGAERGPAGERRLTSMSNGEGILEWVVSLIIVDEDVRIEIGWNGEGREKLFEVLPLASFERFCPLILPVVRELLFTPPG